MELIEIFSPPYMQRALIVLLFVGITFPLIGVFIINLKLIPLRFAIMHIGLLGGAIGLFFKINPLITALLLTGLFSFFIGPISDKLKLDITGLIGFFMVTTMAIAFIFFYKGNIHAIDAFSIFWGNILSLTTFDVFSAIIISLIIMFSILILFKEIKIILFNRELALSVGLPEKKLYYFFLFLTGISIGYSMKIIGALLIDAVILLPALCGFLIAKNIKWVFIISSIIGIIANMFGLLSSSIWDLPTSSMITVIAGLLFIICLIYKSINKLKYQND